MTRVVRNRHAVAGEVKTIAPQEGRLADTRAIEAGHAPTLAVPTPSSALAQASRGRSTT